MIGDEVNVRLDCSIDDQAIGTKYYGEEVQVTGTVQKDGAALGWSQISFNNTTAYISSAFLSEAKPQARTSSAGTASTGSSGSTGSSASNSGNYAIEPPNGTQDPSAPGQAYCIYCGQYYPEGNIFRNHVCPRRDEAYAGYAIEPLDGTQDPLAGN